MPPIARQAERARLRAALRAVFPPDAPVSQREVCRAAGVNHSYLARILRGEKHPTPELCRKLAVAFRRLSSGFSRQAKRLNDALSRSE